MNSADDIHVIFDFDQTLIDHESTIEIIKSTIADSSKAQDQLKELRLIAPKVLAGTASAWELLSLMKVIPRIRRSHLTHYIEATVNNIEPALRETLHQLQQDGVQVHILSGGYMEWITPIVRALGINPRNVLANRLFWLGSRALCPRPSPLINPSSGKSKITRHWRESGRLKGRTLIVGDATSDYQVYANGWADGFVCADYYVKQPLPELTGQVRRATSPGSVYPHIQALLSSLP
ncbi:MULTISPECIES: HAD-IB family phosphatase [Pseudomonas]|jgi:phosphoserine phosphatase|uniref:HAD-IB family phosphatase n=1 Tax=Pseudomonas TaxID=286 RepID=UPI0007171F92|nr:MULTISPECIES: HAD-IB family phosphatase [Pseudomonas]MBJ2262534.1 HAD-IB family phosphatase [Pseudomonas sp. MF6787]MDI3201669.1 HAD-IB family phosphatase [Pseudomonas shahriarae]MDZ4305357.1 HAD-IB family phosphatase [Pseudomonas sp.]QYM68062.1 HAD-IB family phosphatase [Pseudomonas sp. So3.2b]